MAFINRAVASKDEVPVFAGFGLEVFAWAYKQIWVVNIAPKIVKPKIFAVAIRKVVMPLPFRDERADIQHIDSKKSIIGNFA